MGKLFKLFLRCTAKMTSKGKNIKDYQFNINKKGTPMLDIFKYFINSGF